MDEKYKVREIHPVTSAPARDIDLGGAADLEAAMIEQPIDVLRQDIRSATNRVFEVFWKGGPMGRQDELKGLQLAGQTVDWLEHGVVTANTGRVIGTYEVVKKREGPEHNEWAIQVSIEGDSHAQN